jgi:3-methyladenine DNA glycosylase/8-oxoguanine DNA glycosylase
MSVTTVGELLKEKMNNFTVFCAEIDGVPAEVLQQLAKLNQQSAPMLLLVCHEMLEGMGPAIAAQDVSLVPATDLQPVLVGCYERATVTQRLKIWKYMACFQELSA